MALTQIQSFGIDSANAFTFASVSATGNVTGNFFIGNGSALTGVASTIWYANATAPSTPTAGAFWYNTTSNVKYQYYNDGSGNYWVDQSFPTSFSTLAVTGAATVGTTLNVTGNVAGGNILTVGLISATGNITGSNIIGNGYFLTSINGANVTGLNTAAISNGTSNVTIATSGGNILVGVGGANIVRFTSGGIENAQANSTGNIGNATGYFNTVFAKATSAQYADLAEMYAADQTYAPGTVVEFGGEQEITATSTSHSVRVAGVISTNPSYLMNATQSGEYILPVALTGRVPCRVVGQISKGDRLVASTISGVAEIMDIAQYQPGCIIGKALESYDSDVEGQIEIAVGRY